MTNPCIVCKHVRRRDIESAILNIDVTKGFSLESVSKEFNIPEAALRQHALFHSPMPVVLAEDNTPSAETLASKLKLREADMLVNVSNQYMNTLKVTGDKIHSMVVPGGDSILLAKTLTKPLVDLYVGLGSEIRKNAKTLAELDSLLNGPKDSASEGLRALAQAIHASSAPDNEEEE